MKKSILILVTLLSTLFCKAISKENTWIFNDYNGGEYNFILSAETSEYTEYYCISRMITSGLEVRWHGENSHNTNNDKYYLSINELTGTQVEFQTWYRLDNEHSDINVGWNNLTDFRNSIFTEVCIILRAYKNGSVMIYLNGDKATSVEPILSNAEPMFYNLNGVRIANPTNGAFIVKNDGYVKKILINK